MISATTRIEKETPQAFGQDRSSLEFKNGTAFDLSFVEHGYRFVNLLDGVAGCDEGIQIQVALFVPLKKEGEILFGYATSSEAANELFLVEQHVHGLEF